MATDPESLRSPAVECSGLSKRYGKLRALSGLDLLVPRGATFGVLGPNGAGKSTLVRLLLGFVRPGAGTLTVLGERRVERSRPRIGYLPERPQYDGLFTAREYLHSLGALLGIRGAALTRRADELIALVGLSHAADRRLNTYSKGMLQRTGVAQALLGEPELLLLDEPTSGLDPRGQWEMGQLILRTRDAGRTILLCSHSLAEVQRICSHACILRHGRVVWQGEIAAGGAMERFVRIQLARTDAMAQAALCALPGIVWHGEAVVLPISQQAAALRIVLDLGVPVVALNQEHRSLEEVYLRATSEGDGRAEAGKALDGTGGRVSRQ